LSTVLQELNYMGLLHEAGRGGRASRFLGLRVRIPPWAWMSVGYECCVLSGIGLCVGQVAHQKEQTGCGVSECDREDSIMRRLFPSRGRCTMEKINYKIKIICPVLF